MITEIIEAVKLFLENVVFWAIMPQGEEGVLLRCGKYKKTVKPGFFFKVPFFDEIKTANIMTTTHDTEPQTITTKDNSLVVIQAIIKYHIEDVRPFILEIWDAKDAISDLCCGFVKHIVVEKTWEEVKGDLDEIDNQISIRLRREVKIFGIAIDKVTLTTIAPIKTYRLILDRPIR